MLKKKSSIIYTFIIYKYMSFFFIINKYSKTNFYSTIFCFILVFDACNNLLSIIYSNIHYKIYLFLSGKYKK